MENTQGETLKLILCGDKPLILGPRRGWAKKYEKPLRAVSMLKKNLWETEISLFSCGNVLHHPAELGQEQIKKILRAMRRKRLLWLLGFSLLIPLTIPLTPIPGPNIPYYYALGRAILHFRSFRNLGKLIKKGRFIPLSPDTHRQLQNRFCP